MVNQSNLLKWFQAADVNHTNHLSATELKKILVEDAKWTTFSHEQCALLISLFDVENGLKIDLNQFQQLFAFLEQWKTTFDLYDTDHSKMIDKKELGNALVKMGYKMSKETVKAIFTKYSRMSSSHKMTFDSFITACIHLRKMTTAFKVRDANNSGYATYIYDDIIRFCMTNTS